MHSVSDSSPRYHPPDHFNIVPIILGQVCRTWRDIALSTALFWSSIHIHFPTRARISLVSLFLKRSGDICPLSLQLYTPAHYTTSYAARLEGEIMRLFVPHVHRVKEFRFRFGRLPVGMWQCISQSVSNLPELDSSQAYPDDTRSIDHISQTIHACKLLARSDWQHCYPASVPRFAYLPWTRMTHLHWRKASLDEVFRIFASARYLKELRLQVLKDSGSVLDSFKPLKLLYLQTFTIIYSPFDTRQMFDLLTLPSLTSLSLNLYFCNGDYQPIRNLMDRSLCKMVAFNCRGLLRTNSDQLFSLLRSPHMQSLTKLSLEMIFVTDPILSLLTLKQPDDFDDERPLLPNLEYLYLGDCCKPHGALLSMVSSRLVGGLQKGECPAGPGLRTLKVLLRRNDRLSDGNLLELNKLRDLGLDLHIRQRKRWWLEIFTKDELYD